MPLDAKAKERIDTVAARREPPLNQQSVKQARQAMIRKQKELATGVLHVPYVEDEKIKTEAGHVKIRKYRMQDSGYLPVFVYLHGGGWVLGDLDTHDEICREICAGIDGVVVSVDYRLAPEHKFPAASDDCLAVVNWLAHNSESFGGDSTRIAVGGDSAGGNLAAVTALRARDTGGVKLRGQLLIYPITDYYDPGTASYQENAQGYLLSRDDMIWFWEQYLPDRSSAQNPYAVPLRGSLENLPPAYVVTAGFDPLRDEGESYAKRLEEAGVAATIARYEDMIHGFFINPGYYPRGREAIQDACAWLRDKLR